MDVNRDIVLTELTMDLQAGTDEFPIAPLVHSLKVQVSNPALIRAVQAVLMMAKGRLPVEVEFEDAAFLPGGAEVTVTAGLNRFLRAKATAVVGIHAEGSDTIAMEIDEIRTLGKISIEGIAGPMIEKVLDKAALRQGISRNPARGRGLLIDPNALLQGQGLPVQFARPGGWTVESGPEQLTARYGPQ